MSNEQNKTATPSGRNIGDVKPPEQDKARTGPAEDKARTAPEESKAPAPEDASTQPTTGQSPVTDASKTSPVEDAPIDAGIPPAEAAEKSAAAAKRQAEARAGDLPASKEN